MEDIPNLAYDMRFMGEQGLTKVIVFFSRRTFRTFPNVLRERQE